MTDSCIDMDVLDDIFDQYLCQSYRRSVDDNAGCSMGRRNSAWLSPQRVVEIVQAVLDNVGVEIKGTVEKPDDEDVEEV